MLLVVELKGLGGDINKGKDTFIKRSLTGPHTPRHGPPRSPRPRDMNFPHDALVTRHRIIFDCRTGSYSFSTPSFRRGRTRSFIAANNNRLHIVTRLCG